MLLSDEQLSSMNRFTSRSGLSKLVDILVVAVSSVLGGELVRRSPAMDSIYDVTLRTFGLIEEQVADGI